ncbi:Nucleoside-diphosphate-sugar epimerase [Quadrisphaera granulorum]|uniref:Nucleoside-diphosphate-sugar epimerase n=1 Tax=Quadrisphaera granulorum TaxID=317664 RepID=A0A316A694_9ACTN|nr:NAD-dependent epimerase/dehydratase family protein [Quadrisphaera granulorum]PWJ53446.1 nucleoside-diphosphate-sugar epimerase [Quadrisphaera granulorum]SZE96788.1 Nucleoside-diphosphate-sugar epimerase [Quadrisphaera granulorum]
MRLLVLGGTRFLGRHVVDAAVRRGHDVATFTRGRSGEPPEGVLALHGDRDDTPSLAAALSGAAARGWRPDVVVDTSCQTRAAAEQAAAALADVRAYALVSSLNAYAAWPPGPVLTDDDPTWPEPGTAGSEDVDPDAYGPVKAHAERALTAAVRGPVLLARAGLIAGPHDDVGRLAWWLRRLARGGRVVVPGSGALEQPMALIDARDLADWLIRSVEEGWSGGINATSPVGTTTLGGLLRTCADVVGSSAEFVEVPEERLLAAGVQPWQHLPYWLPRDLAATTWDVATPRAQATGLVRRSVRETVEDTWAWLQNADGALDLRPDRPMPGLPDDLERELLGRAVSTIGSAR